MIQLSFRASKRYLARPGIQDPFFVFALAKGEIEWGFWMRGNDAWGVLTYWIEVLRPDTSCPMGSKRVNCQ
jgi:hypothetical protein